MLHYSTHQLASIVAIPIVTILLFWTLIIFQKNRKRWDAYDIPIVCLLILSILRNISILAYTLIIILNRQSTFNLEYCSIIIWTFNSIHTFQASSLTTIAIIGLFSAKLHRKQQHLRQFLTATHIVYHLFCLTTLCACVGVAAILAQQPADGAVAATSDTISPCRFMPFDLDMKFNVFIIVLHLFLATVSFISFILICYNYLKAKKTAFDYLKKSNSDLSEFSVVGLNNTLCNDGGKHFYDTYTINRNNGANNDFYENATVIGNTHFHNTYGNGNKDLIWNSDMSNFSTTVSSTNSRRPCIAKHMQDEQEDCNRTGLETIHPVLIVCYLFYHLPIIALCIYPKLILPWPVVGAALWLGLVQDLLIPIGLGIVDSRFCKWVSNVYRCSGKHLEEKLPQVGLNGKFRPFGNVSQPQSLEIMHQKSQQERNNNNPRTFQSVEHRFPITNGSLYTSIDGRLPVIHNYRRHHNNKGIKTETLSKNVALHSNHLKQVAQLSPACLNCEMDSCPSHSNLHHLSPHYVNKKLHLMPQNNVLMPNRMSVSEETLHPAIVYHRPNVMKSSRNLVRLNRMRLSKSEDSLNDLQIDKSPAKNLEYTSSSEDEFVVETQNDERSFDSISSKSCYSITTEANGDFEFYQNKSNLNIPRPYISKPNNDGLGFRITRSNSKQSLENLQAFITEREVNKLQRSNSYMTLEDRKKCKQRKQLLRSNSKLSDCTQNIRQKIKSVEYLPNSNSSTVYIEDVFYYDVNSNKDNQRKHVGSVPDFKKIFISEYI